MHVCTICINIVAAKISEILYRMIKYKLNLLSIEETKNKKKELINAININGLDIDKLKQIKNILKSSK